MWEKRVPGRGGSLGLLLPGVVVLCCCITNYPQMFWLKTINTYQFIRFLWVGNPAMALLSFLAQGFHKVVVKVLTGAAAI